jgi:mono/diheme cytochrome c family protein
MRRYFTIIVAAAGIAAAALWFLTAPQSVAPEELSELTGDPGRGEAVFWAGGCASCHAAPGSDDRLTLAGGHKLVSDFGTFSVPNISPDPEHGIGGWSVADFASALLEGTSPDGKHHYPAFPFATYTRMELQDVVDLKSFMDGLPMSDQPSAAHELAFPFSQRGLVGFWKVLAFDPDWVTPAPLPDMERGRYLVEALAHCGECHTPRNLIGGLDRTRWMAGAPNPSGRGTIPGLTPAQLDWTAEEIAYYLEIGFTPEFDSVGGSMASVVRNMGMLPPEDRMAIAEYIKALPAVE